MVRLEVISGDDAGLVVERDVDVLRIGRAADSHVPLTAHHVSGTHASVVFCAEGHVVRDHHSTNGNTEDKSTPLTQCVGNEAFSVHGCMYGLAREAW